MGKMISRKVGKGYVSYFNNYVRVGSIYDILNIDMDNDKEFEVIGNVFRSKVLDQLLVVVITTSVGVLKQQSSVNKCFIIFITKARKGF
jgi:hypothetical protein